MVDENVEMNILELIVAIFVLVKLETGPADVKTESDILLLILDGDWLVV